MKTLNELIEAGASRAAEITKKLEAFPAGDDTPTAEEQAELDGLHAEAEALAGQMKAWKASENALVQMRAAGSDEGREKLAAPASVKERTRSDNPILRAGVAAAYGHMRGLSIEETISKHFPNEARALGAVLKVATPAADTSTTGWAAEVVQDGVAGFMGELRGRSVMAQLAVRGVNVVFGRNGSVSIPGWAGTDEDLAGDFVEEGEPIPVKRGTLSTQQLLKYNLGVITVLTKKLRDHSIPEFSGIVQTKILDDTAKVLDKALMSTVAAGAKRPAGIYVGAETQAATGTGTADDINADIKFLFTQMVNENSAARPVMIMNSLRLLGLQLKTNAVGTYVFASAAANGNLAGAEILHSTHVPADEITALDASTFASGFNDPMIDASENATVVMADGGVAPTVGEVGDVALDPAGAQITSLWQTQQIGLRMDWPTTWKQLRPTVSYITGADW